MPRKNRQKHAVIVGAGVIGASIAYHLSLYGVSATILEASSPAAGASGASDGAVSVVTKSPGPLMELGVRGKDYYSELSGPGGVLEGVFHHRSAFLAATTELELRLVEKQEASLRGHGINCRMLSNSALQEVFPRLGGKLLGVLEVANEGHAIGYEVVDRFIRASGASIRRNCPVANIEYDMESGSCIGVRTANEKFHADYVVLAAGLSSARLLPQLEIFPQRGQLIVTDRAEAFRRFPGHLFFASYLTAKGKPAADNSHQGGSKGNIALVIDPLRTGQLLIGSTREPGDDVSHTDFESVREILQTAVRHLPELADVEVLRVFAGVRAVMADRVPVLGPVRSAPGLFVATGFGGDGISLAPIAGRELVKLLMNEVALGEIDVLSPSRFADLRAA